MASDMGEELPSCPECGSNRIESIENSESSYDLRCTDCGYEFGDGGAEELLA